MEVKTIDSNEEILKINKNPDVLTFYWLPTKEKSNPARSLC